MKRKTNTGNVSITSYIPKQFAIIGSTLKLRNDDGCWGDGWVVESIGPFVDGSLLPDVHKAIRKHRSNTGDSLPKVK